MRHFQQLAAGIDVGPLAHQLALAPGLWNENDLRTTHPQSAHVEADDIWLWFNDIPDDPTTVLNDIQTRPYPAWRALTASHELVFDLMRRVGGSQLGRVLITRLRPGAIITPHVDEGAPATFYTRYQIAVQSLPGALFNIGDETVNFATGDVWWIDNRTTHSVVNNSVDDRIVCIVDIRAC